MRDLSPFADTVLLTTASLNVEIPVLAASYFILIHIGKRIDVGPKCVMLIIICAFSEYRLAYPVSDTSFSLHTAHSQLHPSFFFLNYPPHLIHTTLKLISLTPRHHPSNHSNMLEVVENLCSTHVVLYKHASSLPR